MRFAGEVGQVCKLRVDQPEEIVKSGLIPGMRGRGQQNQMTFAVVSQRADQFVAALPPPAAAHGGMRLVDDDHLGAGALEVEEAPLALDEVEADDRIGVGLEYAHRRGQVPFEPCCSRCRHRGCRDGEFRLQLPGPLIDEVRRAQHREPVDLAAIQHLTEDQPGFDCLADAHIIGIEEPDRVLAQRHHEGRQLIGARREVQAARASERPRAPAQ